MSTWEVSLNKADCMPGDRGGRRLGRAEDRAEGVIEAVDVAGGQRLLGDDVAKLVVVIVESLGGRPVDLVHHVKESSG